MTIDGGLSMSKTKEEGLSNVAVAFVLLPVDLSNTDIEINYTFTDGSFYNSKIHLTNGWDLSKKGSTCCLSQEIESTYETRVLTFEDNDYKGDFNFAGKKDWSSLIDDPQYGGPLLYGDFGMGVFDEGESYTWYDEGNTELYHVFPYNWGSYCYWGGGHAISNYVTSDIEAHGGYDSQLTIYKPGLTGLVQTGGGHNGSNNFCVQYGYRDSSGYSAENIPSFMFWDGVARTITRMYVTNTTYALNCYVNGNGLSAKIGEDDWVKIVAIGYDENDEETGEVEIYLCDGPEHIIMDWTEWDLSSLGNVLRVEFNILGSSDNGYGFSQPAYFAYDDVEVLFEVAKEQDGSHINSEWINLE